jgi:hypothetical protein
MDMQAGQCGSQMGTDNDEQLGRIYVFYHEAPSGKYVPRAVF